MGDAKPPGSAAASEAPPGTGSERPSSRPSAAGEEKEPEPPEVVVAPEVIIATNKEFIHAAGWGDVEKLQTMMDSSPEVDVNFEDDEGWTALIWSSGIEQVDVMRLLDEQGAVIDRLNKDGYTALRFAAANGKAKAVQCLMELGADSNLVQQQTTTPFIAACGKGKIEVMKKMLDFQGVQGGAKMDLETPAGKTALHEACSEGQFAAAEMLLTKGARVQKENKWGRTALMEAALYGRCEIIELLVKFHAKVNAESSKDNATAIQIAHEYKQRQAVGTLEENGASADTLHPTLVESFRSRRDKIDVAAIVMQRFGEERFCKMLDPGGSMEIPKLRKPTEGHLAMVERDYIDKGLISEVDESRQATEQGDGVGNLPDKDGSGPPSTAMSWADQGSRPDSKVSGSRPGT